MRIWIAFLAATALFAQEPAPKSGTLSGKALNAATNEPLRKATLRLQPQQANGQALSIATDNDGSFLFENLPPGDYRLSGEKSGFLRTNYGARTASSRGSLISVASGTEQKDLLLRVIPAATLSGRVIDEDGEPMEGAVASILLRAESGGAIRWENRLRPVATNERGEFRISGIPPGPVRLSVQYKRVLPAADRSKEEFGYPATYFPGVDSINQAQTLQLQPGQELSGLQIAMRPIRVYRIKGRYTGSVYEEDEGRIQLLISNLDAPNVTAMGEGTISSGLNPKNGSFELPWVRPGSYRLSVVEYKEGRPTFLGSKDVVVSAGNVEGIVIEAQPPIGVAGKLLLEGEAQGQNSGPPLTAKSLQIQFLPADLSLVLFALPIPVFENGTFQIEGVTPNRFHVNVLAPPGRVYIKSIRAGGRELADHVLDLSGGSAQLEIVVSDRVAKLKGRVERASPETMPGFAVVEKIGSPSGMMGQALTYGVSQNGAFEELDLIYLRDDEFLKKFATRAVSLKIAENESKEVTLKQISFAEVEAATKQQ